jgi:glutamate/tyrosine decarboxylase-like PLP-dependent enzyme
MSELQHQLFLQQQSLNLLKQAAEYAYQYTQEVKDQPAYPTRNSLAELSIFSGDLPIQTSDPEQVLKKLAQSGGKNTVHYSAGRYFGFVNGGILPIGHAARWLADTWDQNAAVYAMSPIAATLESVCEKWLGQLFKLPENTVAGLVGGTSTATLCGLAAARYRQLSLSGWDQAEQGLFGAPPLRIIMGRQTHGTVTKMLNLLGFGQAQFEWIDSDEQGRIRLDKLPSLDPSCILVLQAGNVCSGAFDHFHPIIKLAKAANAWVHVDGAFGLWAAASDKFANITHGINEANSWSVDGHKTLNTPYDCGIILCTDDQAMTHALHQQGSYLQASEHRDNMMYTPDMSRRARGIDLWACMAYLGQQGIAELIELLHQRAQSFARQIKQVGFDVLNDVVFNQVMLSCGDDEVTARTLANIQESGEIWCGGAKWNGTTIIRVSVCSWATRQQDIDHAISVFTSARDNALK